MTFHKTGDAEPIGKPLGPEDFKKLNEEINKPTPVKIPAEKKDEAK
jgi:hypothetical protein